MIFVGPAGNIITGDILDVNKKLLERALRDYDSQLYLEWNPKKLKKHGAWELRRLPEYKTAIHQGTWNGQDFFSLDYVENDFDNHIKDFAFLNYEILEFVKRTDLWKQMRYEKDDPRRLTQFLDTMDKNIDIYQERETAKNKKEMTYNLMQDKSIIRDFKEDFLSGTNPAEIARHWDNKEGQ